MKKLSKEEMKKVLGGVYEEEGDEGGSCKNHRQCERRHGPNCLCSSVIHRCGCVEAPYDPPAQP